MIRIRKFTPLLRTTVACAVMLLFLSVSVTTAVPASAQVIEESTPGAVEMVENNDDTCVLFLDDFIHPADNESSWEVEKLQMFLNAFIGSNLEVSGVYDAETIAAVERFQLMYSDRVLLPWAAAGFNLTPATPTGYVYITTRNTINNLLCVTEDVPRAPLVPDTNVMNEAVGV